jgi:uncharacterized membrane protein
MFANPAREAPSAPALEGPDCLTVPVSDLSEVSSLRTRVSEKNGESISLRKAIAKAVTWRLIGTAEIFAIAFWTTGHIATASHTAGLAAITSIVMYVVHELAWSRHEGCTE